MAATLADADEARTTDALKEVELLDANVAKTVAAWDASIDGLAPMVRDPVELTPVDALTFTREEVFL